MPLSIGVLIIGSLYWREDGRKRWRDCRLDMQHQWLVKTPIRYGRRSGNGTYTMVFADPDPAITPPGQAIVVPCRRQVNSGHDLVTEAEWLWAAEHTTADRDRVPHDCDSVPVHRISPPNNWGCVALLSNPQSSIPQQLLDDWANRVAVAREPNYNANSQRRVSARGILDIPWPVLLDGKPLPLDLVLATSNDPSLPYPNESAIADAWNQNRGTVTYFCNNRKHHIETFQDAKIEKLL